VILKRCIQYKFIGHLNYMDFFFCKQKFSFSRYLKTWTKVVVSETKFVGLFLKLLNRKYTAFLVFISKSGTCPVYYLIKKK